MNFEMQEVFDNDNHELQLNSTEHSKGMITVQWSPRGGGVTLFVKTATMSWNHAEGNIQRGQIKAKQVFLQIANLGW